jgi:hypothetical protein
MLWRRYDEEETAAKRYDEFIQAHNDLLNRHGSTFERLFERSKHLGIRPEWPGTSGVLFKYQTLTLSHPVLDTVELRFKMQVDRGLLAGIGEFDYDIETFVPADQLTSAALILAATLAHSPAPYRKGHNSKVQLLLWRVVIMRTVLEGVQTVRIDERIEKEYAPWEPDEAFERIRSQLMVRFKDQSKAEQEELVRELQESEDELLDRVEPTSRTTIRELLATLDLQI